MSDVTNMFGEHFARMFNIIPDTIKVEMDDSGDLHITGRQNGTIKFVSIKATVDENYGL